MAVYYVKSGAGATEFAQSTAYTSGNKIVPKRSDTGTNHLVAKRYVWECTTAGTSAAAEPTWPSSVTADTTTVTSGTAVFTARKPGFSSGATADWTFATIYLDYVGALAVAGDTVYVSNNHAESVGANAVSFGVNSVSYICVDDGATPPTTLATTATVTTGAANITAGVANCYVYGITFIAGSGETGNRSVTTTGFFQDCSFQSASSGGTTSGIIPTSALWRNCTVKFGAAGHYILNSSQFAWRGGSLLSGGTSPTSLFAGSSSGAITVENVDLSNAASTINLSNISSTGATVHLAFRNVKLPAGWSGLLNATATTGLAFVEMSATDNAGNNYIYRNKTNGGEVSQETTLVRTGGATNGTTAVSYKMVTTASAQFPQIRARTPDIVKWNETTGSSITVTVELLHDSTTKLTDGECWMDVSYYGESGSPLGSYSTSAKGFLASASDLTTSTETWTTTGMSNPNKQKISLTFTPQLKGFLIARVMLAKASKTIYVDPKLTVT